MNTTYPKLSADFQQALDAGHITCRKHPEYDLWILNYTPEVQFDKLWTPVTSASRGLIVDEAGTILSRPFSKFFNLSEHDSPSLPSVPYGESFTASEKLDGSLGISYLTPRGWQIATRGSFESEQAAVANSLLHNEYSLALKLFDPKHTYLFEIIYPENRIVVDYGDKRELVLLAVIETATGKELDLKSFQHLPFRQPRVYDVKAIEELPQDTLNFEGYVIRFQSGLRVKVKLAEYVKLHKLISGITPKRLWENLSNGTDVDNMIKSLPDELYKEVTAIVQGFREQHAAVVARHKAAFDSLGIDPISLFKHGLTRKVCAQRIFEACKADNTLVSGILFLFLDAREDRIAQKAWAHIEPESTERIAKADLEG